MSAGRTSRRSRPFRRVHGNLEEVSRRPQGIHVAAVLVHDKDLIRKNTGDGAPTLFALMQGAVRPLLGREIAYEDGLRRLPHPADRNDGNLHRHAAAVAQEENRLVLPRGGQPGVPGLANGHDALDLVGMEERAHRTPQQLIRGEAGLVAGSGIGVEDRPVHGYDGDGQASVVHELAEVELAHGWGDRWLRFDPAGRRISRRTGGTRVGARRVLHHRDPLFQSRGPARARRAYLTPPAVSPSSGSRCMQPSRLAGCSAIATPHRACHGRAGRSGPHDTPHARGSGGAPRARSAVRPGS